MAPRTNVPEKKRRKKRKSRTEVSSDSDISESESKQVEKSRIEQKPSAPQNDGRMSDAEVSAAFTKFYMQRMTTEFANDLDRLRSADDFKDDAMPMLINALQQGTSLYSMEEQRRIVMAEAAKHSDVGP